MTYSQESLDKLHGAVILHGYHLSNLHRFYETHKAQQGWLAVDTTKAFFPLKNRNKYPTSSVQTKNGKA